MNRRATFLLLILVLLIAPAANAWCSTVCLAAAISSGCAHGLQATDDLPMAKAVPALLVQWTPVDFMALTQDRAPVAIGARVSQRTPLRI